MTVDEIIVTHVATIVVFLGAYFRLAYKLRSYEIEHEILMEDYRRRNKIELEDIPTRHRGVT